MTTAAEPPGADHWHCAAYPDHGVGERRPDGTITCAFCKAPWMLCAPEICGDRP